MKRVISLFAALLVLLPLSTTACSNDNAKTGTDMGAGTSAGLSETAAESEAKLEIPDYDRQGEVFTILTGEYMKEKTQTFSVDTDDGDTLNTALYKRNLALKERFNIGIEELGGNDVVNGTDFKKLVQMGDDTFGIGIVLDRYALSLALDGCVVSMDKLPNVNLDKPWWYQNAKKELSVASRLFFTFGYQDLSSFDSMCLMIFNKSILSDLNLADPYDLVRSGVWTIDKLIEMAVAAQSDTDGDGEMTENDRWGMSAGASAWGMNFTAVSGEPYMTKDGDDQPALNVLGNDKLIAIVQKLFDISDQNLYFEASTSKQFTSKGVYENCVDYFMAGHSLFTGIFTGYAGMLREMEGEYGIIPFPKYDEVGAGTEYSGFSLGGFACIVPQTCGDLDFASSFLEAAAYESYITVMPAYYDTVVLVKQTRDEDSAEMIQMMNENRVMDMAQTYWLDTLLPAFAEKNSTRNVVSAFTKYQEQIDTVLQEAAEKFRALK